jgi:hypothetical protein
MISALAGFERDLIRERVKSGLSRINAIFEREGNRSPSSASNASSWPSWLATSPHQTRQGSARHAPCRPPYRLIGHNLGLPNNTVMKINKRGSIAAAP